MKFSPSFSLKHAFSKGILLISLLIALATSLFVVELTILLFAHFDSVSHLMSYTFMYPSYGYDLSIAAILSVTWFVIFGLVYATLLLLPALWFGAKRGWKAAALVLVFECMWLIFFGIMMNVYFPKWSAARGVPNNTFCIDCYVK